MGAGIAPPANSTGAYAHFFPRGSHPLLRLFPHPSGRGGPVLDRQWLLLGVFAVLHEPIHVYLLPHSNHLRVLLEHARIGTSPSPSEFRASLLSQVEALTITCHTEVCGETAPIFAWTKS